MSPAAVTTPYMASDERFDPLVQRASTVRVPAVATLNENTAPSVASGWVGAQR